MSAPAYRCARGLHAVEPGQPCAQCRGNTAPAQWAHRPARSVSTHEVLAAIANAPLVAEAVPPSARLVACAPVAPPAPSAPSLTHAIDAAPPQFGDTDRPKRPCAACKRSIRPGAWNRFAPLRVLCPSCAVLYIDASVTPATVEAWAARRSA